MNLNSLDKKHDYSAILGGSEVKRIISSILLFIIILNMTRGTYALESFEEDKSTYLEVSFEHVFDEYGFRRGKDVSSYNDMSYLKRSSSQWEYFPGKTNVPLTKPWTITFSRDFALDEIDGIVIEKNNEFIPVKIRIIGTDEIIVEPVKAYEKNTKYTLKIFLNNLNRYSMDFYTVEEGEVDNGDFEIINWKDKIDIYNGIMDLASINLREEDLLGFDIIKEGKRTDIDFSIDGTKVIFKNELKLNTSYALRVFTYDSKYEIRFTSGDLPEIYESGDRIVVKVPAMPEKGFNWPYYLAIPSNDFKYENQNSKRYLMVDTTNSGVKSLKETENWVKDTLENMWQYSVSVAEQLWTPMIMPVFPRTNVSYYYEEHNAIYEHAFDRDIATLHNKVKDPVVRDMLEARYEEKGFNLDDFLRLDEQLVAMFEHAVDYLNKYGHYVETDKMFLCGYSASGTFTDRLAALQPDKVKAVASGGTLDDMILPLDKYNNKDLIFPIGTYDYRDITGRDFDLSKHNSVARLIYMGKDDTNNTIPYSDCYGDTERNIIISLWGEPVLPRAQALIKLYGESGGQGIFILDKDTAHGMSRDMGDYVLEFFKANRDIDKPFYPIPQNPNKLEYVIYQ